MHINDQHPLNMRRAFPKLNTVIQMNITHQHMRDRIEQAHPDSLALQQVQAAQYAQAFADLQRAIDRLAGIQQRVTELALKNKETADMEAYLNAPHPELNEELARIGL